MIGFAAIALPLLALTSAASLEKKQTVAIAGSFSVSFPAFSGSNTTASGSVSGSFAFAETGNGVSVTFSLSGFATTPLTKRQTQAGVAYTINSGVASTGCGAVGGIIPGGDLSGRNGLLTTDPANGAFIDTEISTVISAPNYIGGKSLVISRAGVIIACGNIVGTGIQSSSLSSGAIATATNAANIIIDINIDINVDVTLSVCPVCQPLTTVYYKGVWVPKSTTFTSFGLQYYCPTAGYYQIVCPYTIYPGETTTIKAITTETYSQKDVTTTTVVYGTPATTTIYECPTSIYVPASTDVITVSTIAVPTVVATCPTCPPSSSVIAAATAPGAVAAAAPVYSNAAAPVYTNNAAAPAAAAATPAQVTVKPAGTGAAVAAFTGAASRQQAAGALALVAAAAALL